MRLHFKGGSHADEVFPEVSEDAGWENIDEVGFSANGVFVEEYYGWFATVKDATTGRTTDLFFASQPTTRLRPKRLIRILRKKI